MLPSKIHAVECAVPGGPEVLRWVECPMPVPAADEVLIKVAAAGLNRADILQCQGKYPPPEGASDIIGLEVAGEIVSVGRDAPRWKTGDKVCALLAGGGYAEYVVAPAAQCLPIPASISLVEAAALPEAAVTIWANLFKIAVLQPGETILVHGGSSGIGTLAIALAKKYGAKTFVTAGSDEKAAACRRLGADLA
ncbi:MAG: alcohol dehydrogenase catalytic domain-containing protein, partial [Alphaproteobacteria bacterium]|nr:alcohol dehydrogenase catalytic domain-containing protein [Alphaproteobacteria bacterium]